MKAKEPCQTFNTHTVYSLFIIQGLKKSLKIAVGAGKSLKFVANSYNPDSQLPNSKINVTGRNVVTQKSRKQV